MSDKNKDQDPAQDGERSSQKDASNKEALEEEKLLLETEILRFKKRLERRKFVEEIKDLKNKPSREKRTARIALTAAVLSAITSLVVAGATVFIALRVQEITDRQKLSDAYASLLRDLGSTNVSARAGAVIGLTNFAINDKDKSKQTVTILVTQLTSEKDSRVLGVLIPSVASLGSVALDDVVRANRDAYQKFRAGVFNFLALNLQPFNKYENIPTAVRAERLSQEGYDAFQKILPAITSSLDTDLLTQSEKQILMDTFHQYDFRFGSKLVAHAEWVSCQHLYLKAIVDASSQKSTSTEDRRKESNMFIEEVGGYARGLYTTSITLGRLIGSYGSPAETDLDSVAVYFADFKHPMLSRLNLRGAYIAGKLGDADLTGADLSGANLQYAQFGKTNLSYATLDDTNFPTVTKGMLKDSDFTGADWWNAAAVKADNSAELKQIVIRLNIKGSVEQATVEERSNCPSDESRSPISTVQNQIADSEQSEYTISLCPQSLLDTRKSFEQKFPRSANEPKREEWFSRKVTKLY
jgi:hypothetical protein